MRFRAIDMFRGIAAVLIILFHMKGYIQLIMGSLFIVKSDIAVDFFFVLSGFVITYSSIDKITDWHSFRLFISKRMYRIYPLHLFTLIFALILETFRFVIDRFVVHLTQPVFEKNNIFSLLSNLTLTHSLGFFDKLTWNIPSWSISSEFYVYIYWGASLILFRKNIGLLLITYFLLITLFIYEHDGKILFTYDYGFIRCLYGFLCGMTLFYINKHSLRFGYISSSIIEGITLCLSIFFIYTYSSAYSWLMPIWFSFVILVFAQESGCFSFIMSYNRFEFLGKLSYSYYLNHLFILSVLDIAFFKVLKLHHTPFSEALYIIFCLTTVHVVSLFTYKNVELRFQKKSSHSKNKSIQFA